jgi:hypothetical protein
MALKTPPTPAMIVATPAGKVLTFHVGGIKDLDVFLQELRDLHAKQ